MKPKPKLVQIGNEVFLVNALETIGGVINLSLVTSIVVNEDKRLSVWQVDDNGKDSTILSTKASRLLIEVFGLGVP